MKISPYILLALTGLFWSLNIIIGKIVSAVIPPTAINLFRWSLPFVIFLPLSWKEIKVHQNLFVARWPLILFLGGTGYCLNSIGVYESVRYTTAINTAFINAFNPVLIAVTAFVLYHERINRTQFLGFVLSLAGVLCIIFQGRWELILSLKINVGDLFMVGSITVWSIHTVLYKHKASGLPASSMFTLMMLAGLLITLPLALLESQMDQWSWIGQIRGVHVLGILCLNIFPSMLAYQFWNRALKEISANQVGIFLSLIPVYTTVISVLFLGEHFKFYQFLGGLLIFIGVLLVTHQGFSGKLAKVFRSPQD